MQAAKIEVAIMMSKEQLNSAQQHEHDWKPNDQALAWSLIFFRMRLQGQHRETWKQVCEMMLNEFDEAKSNIMWLP